MFREPGQEDRVFVQCWSCKSLVARYIIGHRGYYHHGKGFESYISGLNRGGHFMSGKDFKKEFNETIKESLEEFEKALALVKQEDEE